MSQRLSGIKLHISIAELTARSGNQTTEYNVITNIFRLIVDTLEANSGAYETLKRKYVEKKLLNPQTENVIPEKLIKYILN